MNDLEKFDAMCAELDEKYEPHRKFRDGIAPLCDKVFDAIKGFENVGGSPSKVVMLPETLKMLTFGDTPPTSVWGLPIVANSGLPPDTFIVQ